MKKRNLLTLTALCLSLGLTVTACQGPAGTDGATGAKGDKGEKGDKGDKGETGAKGEDGKTYLTILVKDWKNVGGSIEQDKYFIQPGESFTLTFKADEGNDIVSKFVVNGEEVSIDPSATSWSPESTVDATGYQVYAEFTNKENYIASELLEFYSDLVENDNQLATISLVKEKKAGEDNAYTSTTVSNASGYATTKLGAVASEALDALNNMSNSSKGAFKDLDNDATASEKVAAAKAYIEAKEAKIKEKYAEALSEAKTEAKATLATLLSDVETAAGKVSNKNVYDKTADKTAAEAKIDACTSVQAIATLISKTKADAYVADGKSIDNWLVLKEKGYSALKTAYGETYKLFSDNTSTEASYKATLASLESLGINDNPKTIYDKYLAKLQAAGEGSFTYVENDSSISTQGLTTLANEGIKELEGLEKEVIKKVVDAVYDDWYDLIEGFSKSSYAPKTDTVSGLKTGLANAVSNYAAGNTTLLGILNDTTGLNSTIQEYVFGDKEASDLAVIDFQSYCRDEAWKDAEATLKAAYQDAKAGYTDTLYQKAITKGTDGKYVTSLGKVEKENDVENIIVNNETTLATAIISSVNNTVIDGTVELTLTYSTTDWYNKLVGVKSNSNDTIKDWNKSNIDAFAAAHKGDFEKIYKAATEKFKDELDSKVYLKSLDTLQYVSTTALDEYSKDVEGWSNLLEVAQKAFANKSNLEALDGAIYEFVQGKKYSDKTTSLETPSDASKDKAWASYLKGDSLNTTTSVFGKAIADMVKSVLGGTSVASATSNLADLYAQDIASYYESVLSTLVDLKNTTNGEVVGEASKAAKIVEIWDTLSFTGDTLTVYVDSTTFESATKVSATSVDGCATKVTFSKKQMGNIEGTSSTTYGIDSWAKLMKTLIGNVSKKIVQ